MYHGEGNRKSPIVLLSYKEMIEEIVISGSDKRWWDYSELWNTTAARSRMVCVVGMAFISQVRLPPSIQKGKETHESLVVREWCCCLFHAGSACKYRDS